MNSGIYEIVNAVNGNRYIGSAVSFRSRFKKHRHDLRHGKHHSRHLQRAWNKYGEGTFEFKHLLICSPVSLLMYEQFCMDCLKPEYNISPIAGSSIGIKHTQEARANMSRASMGHTYLRGYKQSEEHRKNNASARIGKKPTLETRNKMSIAMLGNKNCLGNTLTQEHRDNIASASLGRKASSDSRKNMSLAQFGRIISTDHRYKISKSMMGNKNRLGCKQSHESRNKISAARRLATAAGVLILVGR